MKATKRLITSLLVAFLALYCVLASDMVGTGYGSSRAEARANAVQDIKSQIIVEQESLMKVKSSESNGKSSESFELLIKDYSRELPLEMIEYEDVEDPTREFGMNWESTAVISASDAGHYADKINQLSSEIVEINSKIVNDTSTVKNPSWNKTLLDLCYDYINYSMVLRNLDPSQRVPELPVSMNRVKLEYEDLVKREKNELEAEISSMTLRLAYGDLEPEDMLLLEKYQEMYINTSRNLDSILGNDREAVEYRTFDYESLNPVTASDYLMRIEANRKAFGYYRSSPIPMESKLVELARNAIDDLDAISRKTFVTNSENEDLSIEVIKYSEVNEGWIGRARIPLGEKTIQFSFLIPYRELVGAEYNDITFARWNKELHKHPEKLIRLNVSYTVKGDYIGNTYDFTVRGLEVFKYKGNGPDVVSIYKAANKNPKSIYFDYGTAVDLGDVGSSSEANALRKKANKDVAEVVNLDFYLAVDAGGKVGLPFIKEVDGYDVSSALSYGGNVSLEAGISTDNGKRGRQKALYGGGVQVAYNFANTVMAEIGNQYRDIQVGGVFDVLANGFYTMVLDGTMDNFLRINGGLGGGFGSRSYFLLQAGASYIHDFTENIGLSAGGVLRCEFGKYLELGINPRIGVYMQF